LLIYSQNVNKTNGNTLLSSVLPVGYELPTDTEVPTSANDPTAAFFDATTGFVLFLTDDGANSNGDEIYELWALNLGGGTGTNLQAMDLTISTPGTTTDTAMVVDMTDMDGDGAPDADVTGQWPYSGSRPTFGGGYTFIGMASHSTGTVVNSPEYEYVPTGNYESYSGPVSTAFGDLHSLEIQEIMSSGEADSTAAIPVANIVVPTGTTVDVQGTLWGSNGGYTQIGGVTNADAMRTQFGGTITAGS